MLYRYEALDRKGTPSAGTTEAGSPADARARLLDQGLMATRVEDVAARRKHAGKGGGVSWLNLSGKRLDLLCESTRHLALLLRAGLPLSQALGVLAPQTGDLGYRSILEDVASQVREGRAFHEALASHPRYFPDLYIHVVKAGAQAGELAKVLVELSSYYVRQKKLRDRVVSALTYPALMCLVGILVLVFLLT